MSRLGAADLSAAVETALYAPAANKRATVRVVVANRNAAAVAKIRVILRSGTGPTVNADYLAFEEAIPAEQSRVSPVFDISNPQELHVRSDVANVTAQANGIERT